MIWVRFLPIFLGALHPGRQGRPCGERSARPDLHPMKFPGLQRASVRMQGFFCFKGFAYGDVLVFLTVFFFF